MMAVCESFERTEAQYAELLLSGGFASIETSNYNHLLIIEALKK